MEISCFSGHQTVPWEKMNLDLHQIRNEAMIAPITFVFWCAKAPAITFLYASECSVQDSSGEARTLSNTE